MYTKVPRELVFYKMYTKKIERTMIKMGVELYFQCAKNTSHQILSLISQKQKLVPNDY